MKPRQVRHPAGVSLHGALGFLLEDQVLDESLRNGEIGRGVVEFEGEVPMDEVSIIGQESQFRTTPVHLGEARRAAASFSPATLVL